MAAARVRFGGSCVGGKKMNFRAEMECPFFVSYVHIYIVVSPALSMSVFQEMLCPCYLADQASLARSISSISTSLDQIS